MEKYEIPLVIFTVFSQMAVGMTLIVTYFTWRTGVAILRRNWLIIGTLFALSSGASIFHLAHPLKAYYALINIEHAWLSREVLCAILFGIAITLTLLTNGNKFAALFSSFTGLILVTVQGITYAAPAMVAIANGLTVLIFFTTVWILGCSGMALLKIEISDVLLRQGVSVFIALMIATPLIWLSGGVIMQKTAYTWLISPTYIGSIICMIFGIIFSCKERKMALIVLFLLVTGSLMSRLTFFSDTVSSIINIGNLY